MNEHLNELQPRSRTRKRIRLDRARFDRAIEIEEITEVVPEGMEETTTISYGVCSCCGKALNKPEDVYAMCIFNECGNVLCAEPLCSGIRCSSEECGIRLCSEHRTRALFKPGYFCPKHALEQNVFTLITGFLFLIIVVGAILGIRSCL